MSVPELKYVAITQLVEATNNYRRSHDPVKHAELVASIRAQGVLTPLVVRQVTQDPEWLYEVAAGHRRLRAARAAGVETMPVSVREMSDAEFVEVMITENVQRVDPDPLDEADAYQEMINALGFDVATLAAKFGKSETYVRQRLVLTRLAAEVRTALQAGTIELGHAVLLARVDEARQVELLQKELLASWKLAGATYRAGADDDEAEAHVVDHPRTRTTVGELRAAMSRQLLPLAPVKWDRDDATLVASAGSCSSCPKRTGANPMLFEEFDPADDRCPDAACYGAKKHAYLEARVQACRTQAPKLVAISTSYTRKLSTVAGLTVLRHHADWAPAKEGKRGTVPAIVVESGRALEDWRDVGELWDVQLVKAEKQAPKSTASKGDASPELVAAHEAAADRFDMGLNAVVKAMLVADADPIDRRDTVLEQILRNGYVRMSHDLQPLLSAVLTDVAISERENEEEEEEERRTLPAVSGLLTDRAARIFAALLLAQITVPHFAVYSWGERDDPAIDPATGAYPIPPVLVELASECGVDAQAAWCKAITAHVTAGAA